jgi:hypothetical protein
MVIPRVALEERRALAQAELEYLEYKQALQATDDRFNVNDPRPEAAIAEERKLQLLVERERRRLRKAELKRAAKQQADKALARERETAATRSSFKHRHAPALVKPAAEEDLLLQDNGVGVGVGSGSDADDRGDGDFDTHQPHHKAGEDRPPVPQARGAALNQGLRYSF